MYQDKFSALVACTPLLPTSFQGPWSTQNLDGALLEHPGVTKHIAILVELGSHIMPSRLSMSTPPQTYQKFKQLQRHTRVTPNKDRPTRKLTL